MSFVDRVKRAFGDKTETKAISLSSDDALELFGSVPTIAGPSINATTALRVPAVFSSVALISGAAGSLPAKVFRRALGGKRTHLDHPAYRLVHDEANEWTSAGQLRTQLTVDALLHGNGFAIVDRTSEGTPFSLRRLAPGSVQCRHEDDGEPFYLVQVKGKNQQRLSFRDVLHLPAPLGLSPITAGKEAIGIASVLERHAAQLFASGARPAGVISNESPAGGESGSKAIAGIIKQWRAWQSQSNGNPLILDSGWKYSQEAMTSVDAQFIESRKFQLQEIARLFRVPPSMLFDLDKSSYAKSEQAWQDFKTNTLEHWLDAWTWAYERVLLTPEERTDGLYIEFVIDSLLSADATTRATTYGQYRAMGAMTANEVRSGLNLPAMEGGDELNNPNITTPDKSETISDSRKPEEAAE